MPKILESVREKILEETEKQVKEKGYSALTIRSVATACGIATGTVYNYFPSKDVMLAELMSKDWHKCIEKLAAVSNTASEPRELVEGSLQAIGEFTGIYEEMFMDVEAQKTFGTVYSKRHHFLIEQIANIITPACERLSNDYSNVLPVVLSELFVIWVFNPGDLSESINLSLKLFK